MMVISSKLAITIFIMAHTCVLMLLSWQLWMPFDLLLLSCNLEVVLMLEAHQRWCQQRQTPTQHCYLCCYNHLNWSFFSLAMKFSSLFFTFSLVIKVCLSTHTNHEGMWKLDVLDALFCTILKLCKAYFQNLSLIHKTQAQQCSF